MARDDRRRRRRPGRRRDRRRGVRARHHRGVPRAGRQAGHRDSVVARFPGEHRGLRGTCGGGIPARPGPATACALDRTFGDPSALPGTAESAGARPGTVLVGLDRQAQGGGPRSRPAAAQVPGRPSSLSHAGLSATRPHRRREHALLHPVERRRRRGGARPIARRGGGSDRGPSRRAVADLADLSEPAAALRRPPASRSLVAQAHHVRHRADAAGDARPDGRRVPWSEAAPDLRPHGTRHPAVAVAGARLPVGQGRRRGIRNEGGRWPAVDPGRIGDARLPERAEPVRRTRVLRHRRPCRRGWRMAADPGTRHRPHQRRRQQGLPGGNRGCAAVARQRRRRERPRRAQPAHRPGGRGDGRARSPRAARRVQGAPPVVPAGRAWPPTRSPRASSRPQARSTRRATSGCVRGRREAAIPPESRTAPEKAAPFLDSPGGGCYTPPIARVFEPLRAEDWPCMPYDRPMFR